MEVHLGDTPEIPMFQFRLWEPVEVFSNCSKFPHSKLIPARFIGISWEHGDAFTYQVWTEPEEGGWKKGKELICNFICPHKVNESNGPVNKSDYEELKLLKYKTTNKKQKRGESKPVPQLVPLPLLNKDLDKEEDILPIVSSTPSSTPTIDPGSTDPSKPDDNSKGDDLEKSNEINNVFSTTDSGSGEIGRAKLAGIKGHRYNNGNLELNVIWPDEQTSWEGYWDMKLDYTQMTVS